MKESFKKIKRGKAGEDAISIHLTKETGKTPREDFSKLFTESLKEGSQRGKLLQFYYTKRKPIRHHKRWTFKLAIDCL